MRLIVKALLEVFLGLLSGKRTLYFSCVRAYCYWYRIDYLGIKNTYQIQSLRSENLSKMPHSQHSYFT